MFQMFRVKICGVTNVADAQGAVEAGADAIGLNFYPGSPRYVGADQAAAIAEAVAGRACTIGVFVNSPSERVCAAFDLFGLDAIQLHGDEPPELLAELGNRPTIRAFRLGPTGFRTLDAYLARCRELGCLPQAILVDALVSGAYGGSGKKVDWEAVRDYTAGGTPLPLVLAGGLSPENVADAIRIVRPAAVDTASGVESSPGRKDPASLGAFVREARAAFQALAQ